MSLGKMVVNTVRKRKEKLLFLTRTLGRAGVGVSLISVLQSLDLERFDVVLGVQFPEKTLEDQVPAEIQIVYYGEITSRLYQKIFDFNKKLGLRRRNPALRFLWHCLNKLEELRMAYKVCRCFGGTWDTANAYHQGVASRYVMKLIRARKKVLWYHAAVIEQPWYEKIFRKANQIITDSENARQMMLRAWGQDMADRIRAMNCLIPLEEIRRKAREPVPFSVPEDTVMLFSCGRLGEEKGMDLAVRAAAIVKEKCAHVPFVWAIVGDGAERRHIETLIAEQKLEDCVRLLGFQSNPYPYFEMCDLYVQPSRQECFGITMAEALVFQKPVITTCTEGGRENVTHGVNGLITEISPEGIAEGVIKLLTDGECRREIQANVAKWNVDARQEESVRFINEVESAR